jgi:glycosidase
MNPEERIQNHLASLYGVSESNRLWIRLREHLKVFRYTHSQFKHHNDGLDQRDAILITYGDQVREPDVAPLQSLNKFLTSRLDVLVSGIHILPFYPYSSDDGFSVIDYRQVDPALGEWKDIARLGNSYRLMFDAVINHISRESEWFRAFLRGDESYADYFIAQDPGTDLSSVTRPRAAPLLTPVETAHGQRNVWTTFSPDQIDLNYANPEVLLEIIDLLLFYVAHGAEIIRLDAIAYLWKEIGTSCIHLPQTHHVVKLFRAVLDAVAPEVMLITETNVPHDENISYFGDPLPSEEKTDEAQMVYNFTLPPLTLYTFHTGNAEILTRWASTLALPSNGTTFFNFLASHDGIGVTPVRGWLREAELQSMLERVQALGGYVSYRNNPDGTQSPYEMNINYLDALDDPEKPTTDPVTIARRFLCAQVIMLTLRGLPGIYFHSMFGSRGWKEGVKRTGRYRSINREKLGLDELEAELSNAESLRQHVYQGFRRLLEVRKTHRAFHPYGEQEILSLHPSVFAILRISPDGDEQLLCLHNVSPENYAAPLDQSQLPFRKNDSIVDFVSNRPFSLSRKKLHLAPYEVLWLGKYKRNIL